MRLPKLSDEQIVALLREAEKGANVVSPRLLDKFEGYQAAGWGLRNACRGVR